MGEGRGVALVLLLATAGCRAFGPPPPELLDVLAETAGTTMPGATSSGSTSSSAAPPGAADPETARAWRGQGTVSLEGRVAGLYQAALAAREGPGTSVRLQLFPDVGPKLLDLAATPERLAGRLASQERLDVVAGTPPPDPGLLVFTAVTLLEVFTPIAPERVLGARREDGGWAVRLAPACTFLPVEVIARVDAEGRLVARRYRYRGARWTEEPGEGRLVTARDFTLTGTLDLTPAHDLPDALFALRLPASAAPSRTPDPSSRGSSSTDPPGSAPPRPAAPSAGPESALPPSTASP